MLRRNLKAARPFPLKIAISARVDRREESRLARLANDSESDMAESPAKYFPSERTELTHPANLNGRCVAD
jgi:hypothetical protein